MAERTVVNDRSEEEYRRDINRAVADTEEEIFAEATGDEELDKDGDKSLEEMGEGLEGEHLDDEDVEDEDDTEVDAGADEALRAKPDEGEEQEEVEEEPEGAEPQLETRPEQQVQPRGIPSERLREEADRRRAAEERAFALERELAAVRGRVDELSTRVNAPPQQQPQPRPARPDQFADPDGYSTWMLDEQERRAREIVQQQFAQFQQMQQQQQNQYVDTVFDQAAQGERGFEFREAMERIKRLDPQNPQHRAAVQGIVRSPDPVGSLFSWWENNGGPEYREQLLERLTPRTERQQQRQPQTPRHETRLPGSMRRTPPSLNSAGGGGRQQMTDPEMLDDSDDSVFRYATR